MFKFSSGTQMDRRHHVIRAFQSTLESNDVNAPTHVFVITVRAGACGVTLTAATSVYILEPQLNPVVETQCAGRVHRLGQKEDIFVKRFCLKDTVEESIVELHTQIAAGTADFADRVGGTSAKLLVSR